MYLLAIGIGKAQDYKKTVSTNRHEDLVIPMDAEKNKRIISQREALNASMKKSKPANSQKSTGTTNSKNTVKTVLKANGVRETGWIKASNCFQGIYFKAIVKPNRSIYSGKYETTVFFKNEYNRPVSFRAFVVGNGINDPVGNASNNGKNLKLFPKKASSTLDEFHSGFSDSNEVSLNVEIRSVCFPQDLSVPKEDIWYHNQCGTGASDKLCFATCDNGTPNIPSAGNCGKSNENTATKSKKSENKKIWVKPGFNENWQSYNNYIANEILTSLVQQGYSFTTRDINDRWQITKIYSTTDFDISVSKSCYQKEMGGTSKLTCTELVGDVRISVKNKAKLEEIKKIFDEYSISIY